MKSLVALLVLALTPPGLAQTSCFTDAQGTTLCSGPEGVVRGNTNSTGSSVYRDDRGNRLDYEVDQFGKASIQLPSGKSIDWSQPVPAPRMDLPGTPSRNMPGASSQPIAPLIPGRE